MYYLPCYAVVFFAVTYCSFGERYECVASAFCAHLYNIYFVPASVYLPKSEDPLI